MATVVQVEDANIENIDFTMLKKTFNTNFLLLKWKNETKICVILNLLEVSASSIKGMFYEVSSDYFVKHQTQFNVFLSLDTHTFVCHQDKLYKMVKLLHKRISENLYVTAFMRFNRDSLSFKTEKRNKNNDAKGQLFAAKLFNEMQRCKHMCGTEKYISDKSVCSVDSTNGRNKTCSSYQLDDSLYSRKKKTHLPRKFEDSQKFLKPRCSVVDVTHKSEDNQKVLKHRCNVVDVTRKSEVIKSFDFVAVSGGRHTPGVNLSLPLNHMTPDLPSVPECQVNGGTESASNLHSRSHVGELHSNDSTNSHSENNHVPMDVEDYIHASNLGQAISHDGTSRNILTFDVSQNDSRSEICIDGSSYSHTGQLHFSGLNFDTDFRFPPPAVVQQNRTFTRGHIGGSTSGQQQQYQQQNRETTFSELARHQAIPQQQTENDLVRDLGRVRSPEYADLTVRLGTFTRWPSDIAQTSAKVAEAGFFYTGFQDTVRCFVCDGGLKNWDPDDDPWIEHARWFPQCAYVRHIKGEEFINLVRMSTEESDEEDDYTVHTGATWGGANNSNTCADSASPEITEPSVLESKDAQFVIEMGFSNKDVAMAINDIFKKGKEDFTSQEIADIILEKEMRGEPSNSMLAVDCPPTIENVSEHARNQVIPQQGNGNDLDRDFGRVRSPEYADLIVRLGTFTRWPSDIALTSAKVAEAGFFYSGLKDTVRCFVCDGGLKNWDPDDDPWIEHARWFPQCAYVRHIKGEEFINLVRLSTVESDEEVDYTVRTGATWGEAKNSNTSADSASHDVTEPSVLESKDSQFVIEMGFSKNDVAMAINDIFKKGKEDFTSHEIVDIILEKEMRGEPSNSMLAVDCPPTTENVSPTENAMFENKRLK